MTDAEPQELGLLAKLVVALAIALIVAEVLWHGVTIETFQRACHNLLGRPSGPLRFRFILQPSMAAIVAVLDGLRDARSGRSPYFWTVLRIPGERIARLREGLIASARIILLGIAMDAIYLAIELKSFYPIEALIIALLLAFVPYLLIRGPVARIARRWRRGAPSHQNS